LANALWLPALEARAMATIYTHAVVGLGLAKVFTGRPMRGLFWVLAGFLPIIPDFDSFSTAAYGSFWGHRGFTHSLIFALAIGLCAAGLTYRLFRTKFWLLALFFFVITATHPLLDACTNGGFGIPFFWPVSEHRFGPWGPIQVADIGFEWPNPWTSRSIRTELWWVWLPTGIMVGATIAYRRYKRGAPR
jgi:inner membrane protein